MGADHYPQTQKRIRLIKPWSVILLMLLSLLSLWIILPTSSRLVTLIAQSSSPKIALTFLNALPQNRTIRFMQAQNKFKLGLVEEASHTLMPILMDTDGSIDWNSHSLYLDILLQKSYSTDNDTILKQTYHDELNNFLRGIDSITDATLARKFANAAISLAMPQIAFKFLLPHKKSDVTDYHELIALALHTSDYENAINLQQEAFAQTPSLELLEAFITLNHSANKPTDNIKFFHHYQGPLARQPRYLTLAIEQAEAAGDLELALEKSLQLFDIEPSLPLQLNIVDLAIATKDLPLASTLLTQIIKNNPTETLLDKLHTLYRWQGKTLDALNVSLLLRQKGANEQQMRAGIEESKALGDIYHEGIFYDTLAHSNRLKKKEYDAWLNALEKGQGTHAALTSIQLFAKKRPYDSEIIFHLARLYSYSNAYSHIIKLRERLNTQRRVTIKEATLFANSYIYLNQPEQALAVLTEPREWHTADENYLRTIAELAWYTSDEKLAKLSQQQLMQRFTDNTNTYRYIQLHSPFTKHDIDELTRFYLRTNNPAVLLLALQVSNESEQFEKIPRLLDLASQDMQLVNNADIVLYRALWAVKQNQPLLAHQLFQQAMSNRDNFQSSLNEYMWWLIATDNHAVLRDVYQRYHRQLSNNADFWSVLAVAAETLEYNDEAEFWYRNQIKMTDQPNPALLLNYASLLERQQAYARAYQLRRYVAKNMVDTLANTPDGNVSKRALIALFFGDKNALQLAEINTLLKPNNDNVSELFRYYLTQGRSDIVAYWHKKKAFNHYLLPHWQQLLLAITQDDSDAIESILTKSTNLPVSDKNYALQSIGYHQQAWQQGQQTLGRLADKVAEKQLRSTHVNQHPNKTHSVRAQETAMTQWNINRTSLDYYAPHYHGYFRLGADFQQAQPPDILGDTAIENESRLRSGLYWQQKESTWAIKTDIAQGVGNSRLGVTGEFMTQFNSYWSGKIKLGINNQLEASQMMTIAGKDNVLGISMNYQATARENLGMKVSVHDLSTRFGDDIGWGWNMNIQVNEQLFFNDPTWLLYSGYNLQKVKYSHNPLNGVNAWQQGPRPLIPSDFITDNYQRFSIGYRLWQGVFGQPGASVPSPRYRIDHSVGYQMEAQQMDMSLSAGLGWRVIGNDELYIGLDWQSQDQNGAESLNLALGYYYSF